jgi:hypothetical protein
MLFVLRLTVLARLGLVTVGALVVCAVAAADIGPVGVSPSVAQVGQAVTIRVQGYLGPKPWRPMPIVLVARAHQPHPFRCGTNAICEPTRLPAALRRGAVPSDRRDLQLEGVVSANGQRGRASRLSRPTLEAGNLRADVGLRQLRSR